MTTRILLICEVLHCSCEVNVASGAKIGRLDRSKL